jgi:hypothetical protein
VVFLYAAFPLEQVQRFEIHCISTHGSWLNMAAMEIGILSRQCLNRRISALEQMRAEVRAWPAVRDSRKAKVHWQFTTADARIELRHLYPKV